MTVIRTREEAPQIVRTATPVRPRAASAAPGFTGKDFLRVLRKRKWLIIITLALFTMLAIGGTFLWRKYKPGYTSVAILEVKLAPNDPKNPDVASFASFPTQTAEEIINTFAQSILTPDIMIRATENEAVRRTAWYGGFVDRNSMPDEMLEEISVTPVPKSHLIRISMSGYGSNYKDDLYRIVNAVAQAAVERSRKQTSALADQKYNAVQKERDELVKKRDGRLSERQIILENASRDGGLENQQVLLQQQITGIDRNLHEVETEARNAYTLLQQYEAMAQQGAIEQHDFVKDMVNRDWAVQNLQSNVDALERELKAMLERYPPNHRMVVGVRARWEAGLDQLNAKKADLSRQYGQTMLTQQQSIYQAAAEELNKLVSDRANAMAQLKEVAGKMAQVQRFKEEAEQYDAQIAMLNETMVGFDLMRKGDGVLGQEDDGVRRQKGGVEPPLRIVQSARRPEEISSPRFVVTVPLGVFLGLAIGLGLAFLLEFTDTSVKSPSDLLRRVDVPMLGMVPHLDDVSEPIRDVRLACLTNPNSLIAESFRQVRTNILFSGPQEQRRSLLVTSPSPEDGRSTVALNLAATMTAGGRRVLLVDANFRQPAISRLFKQLPSGGLSSALVGEGNWQDLVAEVEPGLSIMAAGPLPPNPAELLDSDQMKQLLREMTSQYDQVIFDGPPAMVVTDASILASLVDGTVLVVRAGDNTYGIVQRTRDNLEKVGAHIMGAVLNGVRVSAGGYLRRNYATFYDYHGSAKLPAK